MSSFVKIVGNLTCKRGFTWNIPQKCHRQDLNFTLRFYPHEFTAYIHTAFQPIRRLGSVVQILEGIPTTGRFIVLVHIYLHPTFAHLSVAYQRLVALKAAIKVTLARNSRVVFAFRGPHVCSKNSKPSSMGGNVQVLLFSNIVREIFQSVQDSVIYLDGWDMSVAIENSAFHPPDYFATEMVKLLLSFVCQWQLYIYLRVKFFLHPSLPDKVIGAINYSNVSTCCIKGHKTVTTGCDSEFSSYVPWTERIAISAKFIL